MFGGFSKSFSYGRRGVTSSYTETVPDISGTANIAWTDNTYFDFWTSQTATSTDILGSIQNRCFQLCFAHQAVIISNDSVNRLAVGTYSTQVASPKRWYYAVGIAPYIQRVGISHSGLSSDSTSNLTSSSGAFVQHPAGATMTVPANTWFIVGHSIIPFRAVRTLAAPRTAQISGSNVVTAFPTIYEYASQSESRSPLQLGGFGRPIRVWQGYSHVMSMKFRLYETNGSAVSVVAQSPFSGGGNSYQFSSDVNSYLSRAASDDWALGTGNFTIEWFGYQTDTTQFQRVFTVGDYSGGLSPITIGVSIESGTFYYWRNGSATNVGSANNGNAWVHWAIVRSSSVTRIYRNGVQFGSNINDTTDYNNLVRDLYIGNTNTPATNAAFVGYITNFRWIKGWAVYSGAFTVPTSALTAVSAANPYGGSNTSAVAAGLTKLLLVP